MSQPRLSVIIVNWKTRDLLRNCLHALYSSNPPQPCEVIVVDNGSADLSAGMVRRTFPDVHLIANAENLGYARANNQGIAVANGEYVVLLNSDALPRPGTLTALADLLDRHPEVGVVSPRLVLPDGTPQPFAFGRDPSPRYLLRRGWRRLAQGRALHNWAVSRPVRVDWVSGACLMTRRAVLDVAGGLDESFFMYFEDVDFCRRVRQAGWQVVYAPVADCVHLGGQSQKQNPAARDAYAQSLATFYRKHYGPLAAAAVRQAYKGYAALLRAA